MFKVGRTEFAALVRDWFIRTEAHGSVLPTVAGPRGHYCLVYSVLLQDH